MNALRVIRVHFAIFKSQWPTASLWLLIEPLTMYFCLGFGVGALVPTVNGQSYLGFFTPGFLMATLMYICFTETGPRYFSRTNKSEVLSLTNKIPISKKEVIFGEIIWATLKGVSAVFVLLLPSLLMGIVNLVHVPILTLLGLIVGVLFSSLGMLLSQFTSKSEHMILVQVLVMVPMYFFSGVFFPVDLLPQPIYAAAMLLPLSHSVMIAQAVLSLKVTTQTILSVGVIFSYLFLTIHFLSIKNKVSK